MKILFRIKDNGRLCGYIGIERGHRKFITINETYLYKPVNAIRLKDGTYKAKNGYTIPTKERKDYELEIRSRNTSSIGKPSLIYNTSYGKLSVTQQRILTKLQNSMVCKFNKKSDNISIDMKDLSALTAYTGLEFSLFERNDCYVVAKGSETGLHLSADLSMKLIRGGFKWSGHTHPGDTQLCLIPSEADFETLRKFKQKSSRIYNSVGKMYIFGLEEQE